MSRRDSNPQSQLASGSRPHRRQRAHRDRPLWALVVLKYEESENVFLNDVISLIDASRIINFGQFAKNEETGYQAFWNVTF